MSGPFPGMDPYLEQPTRWQGVHNAFITYLVEALNAVLPMPYAASAEERCWIGRQAAPVRPGVALLTPRRSVPLRTQGATAVRTVPDAAIKGRVESEEEQEVFVNIVNVQQSDRVVTTIELLSHTNKTNRDAGRRLYLRKQRTLLASWTHLIEIDLLRSGMPTVAVPPEAIPAVAWDYLVCLHRAGEGESFELWPFPLRDRLPCITVPLEEPLDDVPLDLQAVLARTYAAGAFERKIDYRQEPEPPLPPEEAIWAETLLRERGLRPEKET